MPFINSESELRPETDADKRARLAREHRQATTTDAIASHIHRVSTGECRGEWHSCGCCKMLPGSMYYALKRR